MGHSAGSHLTAILTASSEIAFKNRVKPWLGTILIDSAALNIVQIMQEKHFSFYDKAFGGNMNYWKSASPYHLLTAAGQAPILAICSKQRKNACLQAKSFTDKANSLDIKAKILIVDLSHKETNSNLGKKSDYTEQVEIFIDQVLK
jgi:arylformamidase